MVALPSGYTDLHRILHTTSESKVNIIAIVVDVLSARRSQAGDWTCVLKLIDQPLHASGKFEKGIRARFWTPYQEDLPKIGELGDVLLFKDVKYGRWQDQPQITVDKHSQWMHFPLAKIPAPEFAIAVMGSKQKLQANKSRNLKLTTDLTLAEQQYVMALRNMKYELSSAFDPKPALYDTQRSYQAASTPPVSSLSSKQNHASAKPIGEKRPASELLLSDRQKLVRDDDHPVATGGRAHKKFRLVQDIEVNTWADLCVEVVKKWTEGSDCQLYVTDYTENRMNYSYPDPIDGDAEFGVRDGDQYGYTGYTQNTKWPGPWQYHVLKIIAKDVHGHFASTNVNVGDIIRLKNVKMRLDHRSVLEGTIWPEFDGRTRQQIYKTTKDESSADIAGLSHRKDQYWAARRAKDKPARPEKPIGAQSDTNLMSRKEKQRQRRKAGADASMAPKQMSRSNRNIHCGHDEVNISSLKDILDEDNNLRHINERPGKPTYVLPFVNANFRAKIQVVDFKPDRLEDFSVPTDDSTDPDLSIESSQIWKWSFQLYVRDATSSITTAQQSSAVMLNVGHREAQFLFGNDMPDPGDLRIEGILLNKLREKMFLLWGDLEEQKRKGIKTPAPNNTPFECCVSEYGELKCDGNPTCIEDWTRQYMLHGVTLSRTGNVALVGG